MAFLPIGPTILSILATIVAEIGDISRENGNYTLQERRRFRRRRFLATIVA